MLTFDQDACVTKYGETCLCERPPQSLVVRTGHTFQRPPVLAMGWSFNTGSTINYTLYGVIKFSFQNFAGESAEIYGGEIQAQPWHCRL